MMPQSYTTEVQDDEKDCESDPGAAGTQYYVIDGLILSPNVKLEEVKTVDAAFENSDHNPVRVVVTLEK